MYFYHHVSGISFRRLQESDLPKLCQLRADSWQDTHSSVVPSLEQEKEWYAKLTDSDLILVGKSNDEEIGIATFHKIDHFNKNLLIGGYLFNEARARGYAKDAFAAGVDFSFEYLGMHRIYAEVLESNKKALMLDLGYLGFKKEGVKRQHIFKCGKWLDSITIGMLYDEWANCERVKSYEGRCCGSEIRTT